MRKHAVLASAIVLAALSVLPAGAAISRGGGFTLVVAPARYSVLQVCFDLIQRESAVLVSYQGEAGTEEPRIHAWNGAEWVPVTLVDFRQASFLQETPERTILIGDEKTLPSVIAQSATWTAQTVSIKDLTASALVNEFGRVFGWGSSDWRWFATRYNLSLQDESEAARKSSWYDQPGPLYRDPSKSLFGRSGGSAPDYETYPAPSYSVEQAPSHEGSYDAGSYSETLPEAAPAEEPSSYEYVPESTTVK